MYSLFYVTATANYTILPVLKICYSNLEMKEKLNKTLLQSFTANIFTCISLVVLSLARDLSYYRAVDLHCTFSEVTCIRISELDQWL